MPKLHEKSQEELPIKDQIFQMTRELETAKICYSIYANLEFDDVSKIPPEVLRICKYYFHNLCIAERAILSSFLRIQIFKFFDSDSRVINLKGLISKFKDDAKHKEMKEKYDALLSKDFIKKLRHRVHAHTDKFSLPEDIYKEHLHSFVEMRKILERLDEIVSWLNDCLSSKNKQIIKSENVESELIDLFKCLAKSLQDDVDKL